MAALSYAQLQGYWIQAGGDPALAPVMAAIGLAESGGDPTVTNPNDDGGRQTSWGTWQISNGDHSVPDPNWADPAVNARLAVAKYHAQGLGAWGTYTSGAYSQYLDDGSAPVAPGALQSSTPAGAGTAGAAGLPSWLAPLLGTVAGQDPSLALPGVLGALGTPVANTFKDFDQALTNAMHGVLWIVNPMNWVRIVAGILGGAAVITGAVLIYQAA